MTFECSSCLSSISFSSFFLSYIWVLCKSSSWFHNCVFIFWQCFQSRESLVEGASCPYDTVLRFSPAPFPFLCKEYFLPPTHFFPYMLFSFSFLTNYSTFSHMYWRLSRSRSYWYCKLQAWEVSGGCKLQAKPHHQIRKTLVRGGTGRSNLSHLLFLDLSCLPLADTAM